MRYQLSDLQKQQVIDRTHALIEHLTQQLGISLSPLPVYFDLKGRTCGMYVSTAAARYIRYNEIIFSEYFDDSLHHTTAHEVAHYAVHMSHPRKRLKPHGVEWKAMMHRLGVPAEVSSRYALDDLPLHRQQRHVYHCQCQQHEISSTRHNRVQSGRAVYNCRACLSPLRYGSLDTDQESN